MTEGRLWSLSRGALRRLRHKDEEDGVVPVRVEVEGLDGAKIVSVACGVQHLAAVIQDGALYTWGRGTFEDAEDVPEEDQLSNGLEPAGLGHDDLEDKLVPTLVAHLHQLVARVGRCLPLPPFHALAFAMGTHRRLGAGAAGPGPRGQEDVAAAGREGARRGEGVSVRGCGGGSRAAGGGGLLGG